MAPSADTINPKTKPSRKNHEGLPVRLTICVDGTGDTSAGSFDLYSGGTTGIPDSIYSIYQMTRDGTVQDLAGKMTYQYAAYFSGVGTERTNDLNRLAKSGKIIIGKFEGIPTTYTTGGLEKLSDLSSYCTGDGFIDILRGAYKICCYQLQNREDEIFLFGFSRGAFIVRALASFLQHVGLIKLEELEGDGPEGMRFQQLFERQIVAYGTKLKRDSQSLGSHLDLLNFAKPSPRVRMIGAFDTVKTVIDWHFWGKKLPDFEMDAPDLVDHFRHALALNEERALFAPSFWESKATKLNKHYLEAWFFGYHHDIGGGARQRGLSLWPLQWILEGAMADGLVLSRNVQPYQILFEGREEVVETSGVTVRMFDVIDKLILNTRLGLLLNRPNSWDLRGAAPRNFVEHLRSSSTTSSYIFLHPSTYLICDHSPSFIESIALWKHHERFKQYRSIALTATPWWRNRAVNVIKQEITRTRHVNFLVYGRPGRVKAGVVCQMFGECFTGDQESRKPLVEGLHSSHSINKEILVPGNKYVQLYYSDGFGPDGNDGMENVLKFVSQKTREEHSPDQIHAILFFHNYTTGELEKSEQKFLNLDFGEIPVILVRQHEEGTKVGGIPKVKEGVWEFFGADRFHGLAYQPSKGLLPIVSSIVGIISDAVHDESTQIAHTKAQRTVLQPKFALAFAEIIRLYSVWHSFKFEDIQPVCTDEEDIRGLSWDLMSIILEIFNVRALNDDDIILSALGSEWGQLNNYVSGLFDKTIPGDLILTCMLDTMSVISFALANRKVYSDATAQHPATPLSSTEVEKACQSYKSAKDGGQSAKHESIRALLSKQDGLPKSDFLGRLERELIDIFNHHCPLIYEPSRGGSFDWYRKVWED